MLLSNLSKIRPKKTSEENECMLQAEQFIDKLPDKKQDLVQNYIDNFTDMFASNEPYLYQQGFIDDIRTANHFNKL